MKVLYAVHGTGHGHAVRALTIARHFPEHEFLFISHGEGAELLKREFTVAECPGFGTSFANHRLALIPTITSNFQVWLRRRHLRRRVLDIIEQFQPDACLSDYEHFLPRACRLLGLPCLSLDHQHIITCSSYQVPWSQYPNYLALSLTIRLLFSQASHYLIISFFQPPLRQNSRVKVLPPLLRQSVLAGEPQDGDHVLVYHGFRPFQGFFSFFQAIRRPIIFYGFNREYTENNLIYKKNSEEGFLRDLASCRYLICSGSHSVISEALYYGKPIISFPMENAFEQYLNSLYVQRLGYGRGITGSRREPELISRFEPELDHFRYNIRQEDFCGNPEIFAAVDTFIRHRGWD